MTVRYALLPLLVLSACAPRTEAPAPPQQVVFTAADFSFSGPDTIAPGMTTILLANQGGQPHHLIIGRFEPGKTLADLMAFFQADPNAEPPFMTWRGAAAAVVPGDTTGSTNDLPAGQYVAICFIPDPADGTPHLSKGMIREFTVAGTPGSAKAPAAEAEIRLKDFGYLAPTLSAGTHTFHVINDGPQTHEIQVVRLNPGATGEQFLAAMAPGATTPPPGAFLGGPGALSTGLDNYWTVTFTPGSYLFICFVPDTDGTPHVMKGMVHEFTVPAT